MTHEDGESRVPAALELRLWVVPARVDALQARVPHLLDDARGDAVVRLSLPPQKENRESDRNDA